MKAITSYVLIAFAMMAFLIPAGVQGVTSLTAGHGHIVQIDKDMGMWVWGGNQWGQLSLGHNTDQVSQIVLGSHITFYFKKSFH
jgi:alpha-tubulin suppressor-like RCC1 family protein